MINFFKRFVTPKAGIPLKWDDSETKLNLGCGRNYREGWSNWDTLDTIKTDARVDVSRDPFPAPDEFFDRIYSNGLLEQISENEGLLHCMNECHRVLKTEGTAIFVVPSSLFPLGFRDPHTMRHFIPDTFRYFVAGTKSYERYGKLYGYLSWKSYTTATDERGLMTAVLVK